MRLSGVSSIPYVAVNASLISFPLNIFFNAVNIVSLESRADITTSSLCSSLFPCATACRSLIALLTSPCALSAIFRRTSASHTIPSSWHIAFSTGIIDLLCSERKAIGTQISLILCEIPYKSFAVKRIGCDVFLIILTSACAPPLSAVP